MGGFHFLDLAIIIGIALAIFGPKTLQSVARSAGKGMGQAKTMKDKVMAELPMEEISKMTANIPQVPLNSRQAIQMLITPSPIAGPVVKAPESTQKVAEPKNETLKSEEPHKEEAEA